MALGKIYERFSVVPSQLFLFIHYFL